MKQLIKHHFETPYSPDKVKKYSCNADVQFERVSVKKCLYSLSFRAKEEVKTNSVFLVRTLGLLGNLPSCLCSNSDFTLVKESRVLPSSEVTRGENLTVFP